MVHVNPSSSPTEKTFNNHSSAAQQTPPYPCTDMQSTKAQINPQTTSRTSNAATGHISTTKSNGSATELRYQNSNQQQNILAATGTGQAGPKTKPKRKSANFYRQDDPGQAGPKTQPSTNHAPTFLHARLHTTTTTTKGATRVSFAPDTVFWKHYPLSKSPSTHRHRTSPYLHRTVFRPRTMDEPVHSITHRNSAGLGKRIGVNVRRRSTRPDRDRQHNRITPSDTTQALKDTSSNEVCSSAERRPVERIAPIHKVGTDSIGCPILAFIPSHASCLSHRCDKSPPHLLPGSETPTTGAKSLERQDQVPRQSSPNFNCPKRSTDSSTSSLSLQCIGPKRKTILNVIDSYGRSQRDQHTRSPHKRPCDQTMSSLDHHHVALFTPHQRNTTHQHSVSRRKNSEHYRNIHDTLHVAGQHHSHPGGTNGDRPLPLWKPDSPQEDLQRSQPSSTIPPDETHVPTVLSLGRGPTPSGNQAPFPTHNRQGLVYIPGRGYVCGPRIAADDDNGLCTASGPAEIVRRARAKQSSIHARKLKIRLQRLAALPPSPIMSTPLPNFATDPWTTQRTPISVVHSRAIPAINMTELLHTATTYGTLTPHSQFNIAQLANDITNIFADLERIASQPFPQCPTSPAYASVIADRLIQDSIAELAPSLNVAPGLLTVTPEKLDTATPRWRIISDTLWANAQLPESQLPYSIADLIQSPTAFFEASLARGYTWGASADLEKSFFQVPIPTASRNVFGFKVLHPSGHTYALRMCRMPMGWTHACNVMHRILLILTQITLNRISASGIHVLADVYIDNVAFTGHSHAHVATALSLFQETANAFAVTIGTQTTPSPTLVHRGISMDLRNSSLKIKNPNKIIERISIALARPLPLALKETLTAQIIYVDGVLNPYGAKRIHALISDLIMHRHRPRSTLWFSPEAKLELHEALAWLPSSWSNSMRQIRQRFLPIVSDASDTGAAVGPIEQPSPGHDLRIPTLAFNFNMQERQLPIVIREAIPMIIASRMFPTSPLRYFCDNSSLVGAIQRRYSPSPLLHAALRLILRPHIPTLAHWIATAHNPMDAPSRLFNDGKTVESHDGSWRRHARSLFVFTHHCFWSREITATPSLISDLPHECSNLFPSLISNSTQLVHYETWRMNDEHTPHKNTSDSGEIHHGVLRTLRRVKL